MTERSSGIKLRARAAIRTGGDYGLKKTGKCAALRSN